MYEIIEKLNYDYLLSKRDDSNFKINNKKINNLIKKKNYQILFQKSLKHLPLFKMYYKYKLNKISVKRENYYFSNTKNIIKDKRIVVFTCVTGSYDQIDDPFIKDDNIDFIVFSDNMINNKIWKNKKIPDKLLKLNDNALINRYIKMHPFEFFEKDYDYALYIDGNIKIMSTVADLPLSINKKTGLSLHRHRERNDIYDELIACKLIGRAKLTDCNNQIKRLKKLNFPKNYGLCECNAILTDLKNRNAKIIYEKWWEDLNNGETHRDQISFMYTLWHYNLSIDDIGNLGNNIYLNPKFRINNHK